MGPSMWVLCGEHDKSYGHISIHCHFSKEIQEISHCPSKFKVTCIWENLIEAYEWTSILREDDKTMEVGLIWEIKLTHNEIIFHNKHLKTQTKKEKPTISIMFSLLAPPTPSIILILIKACLELIIDLARMVDGARSFIQGLCMLCIFLIFKRIILMMTKRQL